MAADEEHRSGRCCADEHIVADILRVDHAGECGAIRIYEAQLWVAAWRAPELTPFLNHALADELRHRRAFADLMRARGVRPCGALPLWGLGGAALGGATALLGRSAILVCTEAVERTVHRHLQDQAAWLNDRDREIADAILAIQVEEAEHLAQAQAGVSGRRSGAMRALELIICAATEALIWLSTYGASARLARRLGS